MITPGTRLGAYEVTGALGAGGMGEVYRARDTRLKRDVALKILPDTFAADAERVARFQREAEVLAALNHPNIAQIYGFEEGPPEGGPHAVGAGFSRPVHALVMELVDGETLADRVARGPLPTAEAIAVAKQIAAALQAAHDHGIVHRDLKPSNIVFTAEGEVKVLDFGLAKLTGPPEGGPYDGGGRLQPALSISPTLTSPMMTGVGMILGTAAYMAPEQAKGRGADKRCDVWAFGCVLFEMLAGRRAFDGEDATDVIAAIVRGEPEWTALPPHLPPAISTVLRQCLEKDRRRRMSDLAVAQYLFNEPAAPEVLPRAEVSPRRSAMRTLGIAAAALIAGAVVTVAVTRITTHPSAARVSRLEIVPDASEPLATPSGMNVAVSPDGSAILYHAQPGGVQQLVLRHLNDLQTQPIRGTDLATTPFFSPDGSRVGFIQGGQLKTISITGGPPTVVCDVPGLVFGASWSADGIVFAQATSGVFRVPASGGRPENIARPDAKKGEVDLRWPEMLPGNVLMYSVYPSGGVSQAHIDVRRLDGGATTTIIASGTNAHYVPGYLVYASVPSTVMAAPFDVTSLQLRGPGVPVLDNVNVKGQGSANAAVADNGTLVYVHGEASVFQTALGFQWFTRDGRAAGAVASQIQGPRYPRLSPDGKSVAVTIGPANQGNVWVIDLTGASQPRELTFKAHNVQPTWNPDGKLLAFTSDREGGRQLFTIPADGSALEPTRLTTSQYQPAPVAWSPDGKSLLYTETGTKTGLDLLLLNVLDKTSHPWLQTEFNEGLASFSPDGRWVAYASDQTGRLEVWVRPFPGPGAPIRISPDGGVEPLWSRNGSELFFQSGRKLMTAEVETREPLKFKAPRVLFEGGFIPYETNVPRTYDVAADGRFLMIQEGRRQGPASLIVVQNWFEDLKRLAPAR